jgi:hypothetical protein
MIQMFLYRIHTMTRVEVYKLVSTQVNELIMLMCYEKYKELAEDGIDKGRNA